MGDRRRRAILWTVLAINAVLFAGEFGAALWADSSALLADSADNLGDMLTYAISIAVVGGALHHRARAARIKGMIQVAFGLGIVVEIVRKLVMGFDPVAPIIIVAAGIALIGNLACLVLLTSQRGHDINMKSVWLCSRNDVIGNLAVIASAAMVGATGMRWLDPAVGAALAALFLNTGVRVIAEARATGESSGSTSQVTLR
ncbi:MAG: cation transporter [Wenzhouxiangellaceae bacterium]|nr:cation transporter [Wenzhouxiangellaceae bacterium]